MIKRLREERGWTQENLAARADVTQGYIAHLEAGTRQRISLEVADRLARALGVGVVDLLQRASSKPTRARKER
jgi:transcriptional regulator with XRE-family HTH domain